MNLNQQLPQWLNQAGLQKMPHDEVNWAQLAQRWIDMQQQSQSHQNIQFMQKPLQNRPYAPQLRQFRPRIPQTMPLRTNSPVPLCQNIINPGHLTSPSKLSMGFFGSLAPSTFRPQAGRSQNESWRSGPRLLEPKTPLLGLRPPQIVPKSNAIVPSTSIMERHFFKESDSPAIHSTSYDDSYNATPFIPQFDGPQLEDIDMRIHGLNYSLTHQSQSDLIVGSEYPVLDSQARRTLPLWIREGLEKAEKEKLKRKEMEEQEKGLEQDTVGRETGSGRGRFDSDEERSDNEEVGRNGNESPVYSNDESREEMDEDDLRQTALRLLRRLMTQLLLDATDEEIGRISSDIHSKLLDKAKPKILVQSSALAALSALALLTFADDHPKCTGSDEPDSDDESDSSNDSDGEESAGTESRTEDTEEAQDEQGDSVFKTPAGLPPPRMHRKQLSVLSHQQTTEIRPVVVVDKIPNTKDETSEKVDNEEKTSNRTRSYSKERRTSTKGRRSTSRSRRSRGRKRRSKSRSRRSRSRSRRSRSPKRRSRSPRRKSRSPKRRSRSPKRRSRSPRRRSRSTRRRSKSPKRRSRSPKRRSKSPKMCSRSPREIPKRSKSPSNRSRSRSPDRKRTRRSSRNSDRK